jgi:hypothetical protein
LAAGLLILFEFALWPRKTLFRVWRIGRTQTWLRAHIWLGLLTVPLIAVHAWRELGGPLSTALVLFYAIVIASGLFGLALQQFLPRVISAAVPGETIYSQIDIVSRQYCDEARARVQDVCSLPAVAQILETGSSGALVGEGSARFDKLPDGTPVRRGGTLSMESLPQAATQTRSESWTGESTKPTQTTSAPAAHTPVTPGERLRQKFDEVVAPYLLHGKRAKSTLAAAATAENFFRGLRDGLPPAMHATVDALEGFCTQRRQFDVQARLHRWLHGWLWVHLPLSAALVVLMFVHIYVALKYW